MKLKIEIEMDNAAFEGDSCGSEAARILHRFADEIAGAGAQEMQCIHTTLRDANGNRVGLAKSV